MLSRRIIYLSFIAIATLFFLAACKDDKADDPADPKELSSDTTKLFNDTAIAVNLDNPVADEELNLRLRPAKGATFKIEIKSNFLSDESMDTIHMKANASKYALGKAVVKESSASEVRLEFTLTDARKTLKSDSGTLEYQFGKPVKDAAYENNRKVEDCLVGTPVTLVFTPLGENTDVLGYEVILKKIKDIVGAQVPDQMIAANVGSPADNLEYYIINYPEKPVRIGDTWENVSPSVLQGVPITLKTVYTLADRKEGVAFVNFTTHVSVDKSQLPPEMAAEVDKISFKAGINGTGQIEEVSGWPIQMQVKQYMQVSDTYQGVSTASKQNGTTTIRWIRE